MCESEPGGQEISHHEIFIYIFSPREAGFRILMSAGVRSVDGWTFPYTFKGLIVWGVVWLLVPIIAGKMSSSGGPSVVTNQSLKRVFFFFFFFALDRREKKVGGGC